MADAKKPSKTIVDVAHPDATPPSPSSKPVIVTNRPVIQDPMVVDENTDSPSPAPSPAASKITIKPLTAPPITDKAAAKEALKTTPPEQPATDDEAPAEPASDSKQAAPAEEAATEEAPSRKQLVIAPLSKPADEKTEAAEKTEEAPTDTEEKQPAAEPDKAETEQTTSTTGAPDAEQPQSDGNQADGVDTADAVKKKAEEAVQKLVDGKQYYLPIKTVEQRRTRRNVMLGVLLSVLLVAAWLDIALDAGLVHVGGVEALTNFF